MDIVQQFQDHLDLALDRYIVPILKRFGLDHWKITLVVRNPDPGKEAQWVVATNDPDVQAVGRRLSLPPLGDVGSVDGTRL